MRRARDEFLVSMARQLEPQPTFPFDHVVIGSAVKVAGDWCQVVAKVTGPVNSLRLSPESDPHARFWYVPDEGEEFLVAEPW